MIGHQKLQFFDVPVVEVRRRGLRLPNGMSRRGVYVLEFANGDRYLGQTPDVIARVGGHGRTWDDITGLQFFPVEPEHLDVSFQLAERELGSSTQRRSGGVVDNSSEPDRDPWIERIEWIEQNIGEETDRRSPEPPGQRERTRPLFDRLAAHPEYAQLRSLISRYVELVIPAPAATERRNWVITSRPSTMRTAVWRRLICLSVNNYEALTIGEQFDGEDWVVCGFMTGVATDKAEQAVLPASARRRGAYFAPAIFKPFGHLLQIGFDSLAAMEELLRTDAVLDLTGELVMRWMRRGRGMYGRFHDYNLADEVLGMPGAGVRVDGADRTEPAGREGFEPSEAL